MNAPSPPKKPINKCSSRKEQSQKVIKKRTVGAGGYRAGMKHWPSVCEPLSVIHGTINNETKRQGTLAYIYRPSIEAGGLSEFKANLDYIVNSRQGAGDVLSW